MKYLLCLSLWLCTACVSSEGVHKTISLEDFTRLADDPKVTLVDVRTPDEIANGKIKEALEIDFRADDFKQRLEQLDRNQIYGIYCRSGGRSNKALNLMKEMGFAKVYELEGGYTAWLENAR